jgi:hypothetical protein
MALALVSLAVVIGVIVIVFVNAAGPATAEEGEAATLSGGATAVTDAAASGGKALQFAGGTTSADPVIAAAGDIACSPSDPNWNGGNGTATGCAHKTTAAAVINLNPTAVLALGDNQYEGGALADYNQVYAPSWGQFKNITYPVIGNHEYGNAGAAGYWNYFGDRATPLQPGCRSNCNGWYSFDIGTWHIVALNSECNNVSGGCSATQSRPRRPYQQMHPRHVARAVLGRGSTPQRPGAAAHPSSLRQQCRSHPQRPRPPLRPVRAAKPAEPGRHGPRHPSNHRR